MIFNSVRGIAPNANGLSRFSVPLLPEPQIPGRSATDTLLLATWNIREFDSGKYGYCSEECYRKNYLIN
jgi:hypothetical protein